MGRHSAKAQQAEEFSLDKLGRFSRSFAQECSSLLNRTVCQNVHVNSVDMPDYGMSFLGFSINKKNLTNRAGVPLSIDGKKPMFWLGFSMRLKVDEHGSFPMVASSVMTLLTEPEAADPVFHIDYERNKSDGYHEAHFQVDAVSACWDEVQERCGFKKPLSKLHFPAGGRRYRPTLEDFVRFLICEGIVAGQSGWEQVVKAGQDEFDKKQLKAAVRRDPESAIEALKKLGKWPD